MQSIIIITITTILILVGACLLGFSLLQIRRLIGLLPVSHLRRKWKLLNVFNLFFIFGYIGYAAMFWNRVNNIFDLIVPMVFFFGAVFVLLVSTLSLKTVEDINRIFVLEHENITDPLMGIYNRRYFDKRLAEEISRVLRYGMPLSILLLDIDYFKNINDTYGHNIGDVVLKNLGQLLLKIVRDADIVARYGGEEIAIITPHTPVSFAAKLAERVCQTVERTVLVKDTVNEEKRAISVTVSIGVAGINQQVVDQQTLVEKVDEALYRAKRGGRNQVVVSDSISDSP